MVSGHSRAAVRRSVFGALLVFLLAGCAAGEERGSTRGPISTLPLPPLFDALPEVTSTTEPEVAAPTTEQAALKEENKGSDDVRELQRRLIELGYDVGAADGGLGGRTGYSIMAFQKVEGLNRTGADNAEVREALAKASKPGPMVAGGASTRVEIDLNRQVLFLWKGGSLARILPDLQREREELLREGRLRRGRDPARVLPHRPQGRRAGSRPPRRAVVAHVLQRRHRHPRVAVGTRLPGVPRVHQGADVRRPHALRPDRRGTPVILVGEGPGPKGARVVPPPEPPPAPASTTTKAPTTSPPTTETPTTEAPTTTEPENPPSEEQVT